MSLERVINDHGLEAYRIKTRFCTGEILTRGALVTSWSPLDFGEVLWSSRNSDWTNAASVHGGIPLCAPWFGVGRKSLNAPYIHGFMRAVDWHLVDVDDADEQVRMVWRITSDDWRDQEGAELISDQLEVEYQVFFGPELDLKLHFKAGDEPVFVECAFHNYLAVHDVRECAIEGLSGAKYFDYQAGQDDIQPAGALRVTDGLDRVYQGGTPCVLVDRDRKIEISAEACANTVLWNPGLAGATANPYLGAEEWREMVCIEPGNCWDQGIDITAQGEAIVSQRLRVYK